MPLISVIIPVYNGEKTLKETIESVLHQTFSDFELIVINDGSQDSTLDILSKISDPRLRVFSYSNAGLAATRNRGFAHSSGEFIAFLDADDLWTADKLERQLAALQANPEAAVAYSWTDYIDESNKFLRRGSHLTWNGDVYQKLLVINFLENGSNPLIRREALTEVGGFYEAINTAADWDMWLRLAAHYHFVAVPSPQILYRQPVNSMSSNVYRQEAEGLQVIERAFHQAPASLQYLKPYSLANLYKYLIHKALEGDLSRPKSLLAAKFLWHAIQNDPSGIRMQVIGKVLLKIAAVALLPPQQSQELLARFKKINDTSAILGYLRTNVSELT
jgi:glycosyltransferase involved in cell wall biosynthesis